MLLFTTHQRAKRIHVQHWCLPGETAAPTLLDKRHPYGAYINVAPLKCLLFAAQTHLDSRQGVGAHVALREQDGRGHPCSRWTM